MYRLIAALALCALIIGGCGDKTMPSPPTPTDLTGAWIGNLTVLGTDARMMWTLTQKDTAVSGPVLVALPSGTVLLNGFLTGTLAGSQLTYTITVGPGNIPAQPNCVGQVGGTMTATIGVPSTLTGTSAVTTSTCAAPFPGGQITLTRT